MRRVIVVLVVIGAFVATMVPAAAAVDPNRAPDVYSISSTSGPETGGQLVTVHGRNLIHITRVVFGATPAHLVRNGDGSAIVVQTPRHPPAKAYVRVYTADGVSSPVAGAFYEWRSTVPQTTTVSAGRGSTVGGGLVLVRGSNLSHVLHVFFGATLAHVLQYGDGSALLVKVPPHVAGPVHIRVQTTRATSPTSASVVFVYVDPPVLTGVAEGPFLAGLDFVGVKGAHFTSATVVLLDGRPVRTTFESSTSVYGELIDSLGGGEHRVQVRTEFGTTSPHTAATIRTVAPWQRTLPQPGNDRRTAHVSCPAIDHCVAVRSGSFTVSGGAGWEPESALSGVQAVACATPSYCLALSQSATAQFDGTHWAAAGSDVPTRILTVDCGTDGSCTAIVGADRMTWTRSPDGHWASTGQTPTAFDAVGIGAQISCHDASHCVAAGFSHSVWMWDGQTWAESLLPTGPPVGRVFASCAVDFCVVATDDGITFRSVTGQTWSEVPNRFHDPYAAVDCSAHQCVAVNEYGRAIVMTAVDARANLVAPPVGLQTTGEDYDVSCPTDTFCASTNRNAVYLGPTS